MSAQVIDPAELAGLAKSYEALALSLELPVKAGLARLTELENRAREARAENDVQGAIENLADETRAYREAFSITLAARTRYFA